MLAAAGATYAALAWRIPVRPIPHDPGARALPLAVGVLLVAVAAWELASRPAEPGPHQPEPPAQSLEPWICLGALAGYLVLLRPLGFPVATAMLLLGLGAYLRAPRTWRQWWGLAGFGIATAVLTHLVFARAFGVPLPGGEVWGA